MNHRILYISLLLVLPLLIIGCDENENETIEPVALTENDFSNDAGLRADPESGIIVTSLEHPDSGPLRTTPDKRV